MPISRKSLAVAAVVIVVAGGAATGLRHAALVHPSGGALTGAEIAALVSGNTIEGATFSEYYASDGTIRGHEIKSEDGAYLGTWHVDGDRLCVAFPSHAYTSCVAITPDKGGEYLFVDDGGAARRTIIAGNPNKL